MPALVKTQVFSRAELDQVQALLADKPIGERWSVLLEGLPIDAYDLPNVSLHTVAACLCCAGQVVLHVTLNRLLRQQRPDRLLIVIASAEHAARTIAALRAKPFDRSLVVED